MSLHLTGNFVVEAMAHRVSRYGSTQASTSNLDGFSKILSWDILTFLAIVQSMRIKLLEFQPNYNKCDVRESMSGAIYRGRGVAFKRMLITNVNEEEEEQVKKAYESLIWEIMVLRNPALCNHPNIQRLLGVAFDVQSHESTFHRVLPVLVFKESRSGDLEDFFNKQRENHIAVPFAKRLQFCVDIGNALEAMHSMSNISQSVPFTNETNLVVHRYCAWRYQAAECPHI